MRDINNIDKRGIISLLNMSKQRLERLGQEMSGTIDKAEQGLISGCEAFEILNNMEQETDEIIEFGDILLDLMR